MSSTKTLVESILENNFTKAGESLSESFIDILKEKLSEAKKIVAAKHGVAELSEALDNVNIVENVIRINQFLSHDKERNTLIRAQPMKAFGRSPHTYEIPKQHRNKIAQLQHGQKVDLPNNVTAKRDGKIVHFTVTGAKPGSSEWRPAAQAGHHHFVDMKEETLEEGPRIKIIKARIRGGKVQRRVRKSGVKGMTLRGNKLVRMSPSEKRARKMGARKARIKRRAKLARALQKRKRSMMKRKASGL